MLLRNLEIIILGLDILMFDITRQYFIGYVPRRDSEVAPRPKMSAPEFLVQMPVVAQKMMRCTPLDHMHHFARGNVRRTVEQQMDVVGSNMPLQDEDVAAPTYFADQVAQAPTHVSSQHRLAVLRDEHKMVVKSVDCVR